MRSPAGPAVSITRLVKKYPKSDTPAVDGLDLEVSDGETLALLGPNGAGKSTTVGICTTRTRPSAGAVRVAGWDVAHDGLRVRRNIGVVTQHNTLDRSCTVFDNLYYHCRFFGFGRAAARERAGQLLEQFALAPRAGFKTAWLSGGMVQRLQIARAVAHRPQVLFLDEPTAGLDPQSRLALWDQLDELRATGTTLFLTTHHMEEAERLADRVAIMDQGRVLVCGTADELKRSAGNHTRVTVSVSVPHPLVRRRLLDLSCVRAVDEVDSGYVVLTSGGQNSLAEIVPAASAAGITALAVREPSLEDVFIQLTRRDLRD
ncbi:MAG TPA: ABC transporter ATP-binding protein [Candidatus Lustribacter sp.]|nr:ABC transporter ATP-binding protein [Candidatus Lustribacter sp.]